MSTITPQKKQGIKVATVVWGVILLVIAGIAFAGAAFTPTVYDAAFVAWAVVGLGTLLVLAAVVGGIARVTAKKEEHPPIG